MQRSDPVEREDTLAAPEAAASDDSSTSTPTDDPDETPAIDSGPPPTPPEGDQPDADEDTAPEEKVPEEEAPEPATEVEPSAKRVAEPADEAEDPPAEEAAGAGAPPALAAEGVEDAEDAQRGPDWRRGVIVTAPTVVLTVLVTGVFLMFLLVEPSPRWVVLFGSAVAAASVDGVLRAARRQAFDAGGLDTTVFLFLPALYALAVPVFLEHNVRGYWAIPGGLLAGVGFGVLVTGLVSSVRPHDLGRPFGRYVAATATYFVAFALFSLMFTFDLHVRPAVISSGLVAALLAAELLRDGEIDQLETLVFSVVTGVVIAQTRLAMHYLPLDGHLAALTLLLAFYFVTGLIHAHVTRQLDRTAALEYVTIAVTGLIIVIGAQAAGIA